MKICLRGFRYMLCLEPAAPKWEPSPPVATLFFLILRWDGWKLWRGQQIWLEENLLDLFGCNKYPDDSDEAGGCGARWDSSKE